MPSKQITIITANELDFHFRAACLTFHRVRWLKPEHLRELLDATEKPDLLIIESEADGVKWLEAVRTSLDVPVILISDESQAALQAHFARRITPTADRLESGLPILEFGAHGVYYLPKTVRLDDLNAAIEAACSQLTDYGDTREQLALHQAVRRLRDFRHSGYKQLVGVQLWLEAPLNAFSAEEWAELNQELQHISNEVQRPLQQLGEAGIAVKAHFPNLTQFVEKSATVLQEWQCLANYTPEKHKQYLRVLKDFVEICDHHTPNRKGMT